MIELIVYSCPSNPKLMNYSPFCAKTEIFLKMTKVPHKVTEFLGNPSKFVKGKLPVIVYKGKQISDSFFIQEFLLKELNLDLDKHLIPEDHAQGFAFSKMVEEYLYWALVHERWLIDSNWAILKERYFGHFPFLLKGLLTYHIRKNLRQAARAHGISRHTDEEVHYLGKKCLQSLSTFLKEKKYFFGNQWSSYDSTFYAFISSILHSDLNPKLNEEIHQFANLVQYDLRMFEQLQNAKE